MPRLTFLALGLLLAACATPAALPPASTRLVAAVGQRLALAREVAWIKYRDHRPVRDPEREAAVLDAVAAQASGQGLDPGRTRAFFAAQIAASCAEQEFLIYQWSRGARLPTYAPRDLRTGVRRDIDAANRALLDALADAGPHPASFRALAAGMLQRAGFSAAAIRLATAPL